MPDQKKSISVGVITNADGAHLGAYFAALAAINEAAEVVLCDPGKTNVAAARDKLGDKLSAVYEDVDQMLKVARPDLAMISVESALAPPLISSALDAGCHVFAEKPACLSSDDFAPLAEKAHASGQHLVLALANRMNPAVREAHRLVQDDGILGDFFGAEIHLIADHTRLTRESYHSSWYADKKRAGGGHLAWLGIHWLDLSMFLTGRDITAVTGFTGNVGGQPISVEDSAAVALQYEGGKFGTMTSGYYLDRGYQSHLRLWGSTGWLEYREWFNGQNDEPLTWYSTAAGHETDSIAVFKNPDEERGYTPFVRHCVRAAAGLEEPPLQPWESLRILNTIYSAYDAAESGKVVTIPTAAHKPAQA